MEYEGFSNYSTWNLALTIDNDKALQDKILKGLDVCARRYVGYSPKASSHPFITMHAPLRDQSQDSVIFVNEAEKQKHLDAGRNMAALYVFGIRAGNFANLMESTGLADDERFNAREVNDKELTGHFIGKHWADALERTGKVKRHTQDDSLSHS